MVKINTILWVIAIICFLGLGWKIMELSSKLTDYKTLVWCYEEADNPEVNSLTPYMKLCDFGLAQQRVDYWEGRIDDYWGREVR